MVIRRTSVPPLSCAALLETSRLSSPLPSLSLSLALSAFSLVQSVPRAPLSKKSLFCVSTELKKRARMWSPRGFRKGVQWSFQVQVSVLVFVPTDVLFLHVSSVQDAFVSLKKNCRWSPAYSSYWFSCHFYCHFNTAGGYKVLFKTYCLFVFVCSFIHSIVHSLFHSVVHSLFILV